MDSSLKIISKEFGFKVSEQRKLEGIRCSVSRTWKAAANLARRQSRPPSAASDSPAFEPHRKPILPPELLDQIVDYLHDDLPSLRSCALVCRALVASARFHLFQIVLINEANFVRATSLFAGKAPHLAEYVRELTLEADGNAFERLRELIAGREMTVLLRVFMLIIASRTRNVVRLTLKDVPFDRNVVAMLAPYFPHIHTISFFDCWFRCNADFDTLVRDHPLVRTIRCGRVCSLYGNSPPESERRVGPPLSLRSLKITEAYSPSPLTLMPWLVTHSNPEHYAYTLYRLSQVTKLNHCLFDLSSLLHLHVIFYRWRKGDVREVINSPAVLTLTPRHPPTITTLTLDGKMHSMFLVIHALAQLDPHSFVRLRIVNVLIHILDEAVVLVPPDAWAGMDQTLSVLLSLGAVNFLNSCGDSSHVEDGKEAIIKRLPVLNVRGILSFDPRKSSP